MGLAISHTIVFIISIFVVGFVLHFVFGAIHNGLFGFRYSSWNDNASTERYVSGYEGHIQKGFVQDTLIIKEKTTSDREQGNLFLVMFLILDWIVMGFGGHVIARAYPSSMEWAGYENLTPAPALPSAPASEVTADDARGLTHLFRSNAYPGGSNSRRGDRLPFTKLDVIQRLLDRGWIVSVSSSDTDLAWKSFVMTSGGMAALEWWKNKK